MKFTHRFNLILTAALLTLGLGACGLTGDDDVAPPTSVATTQATTTTSTTVETTTSTTEATDDDDADDGVAVAGERVVGDDAAAGADDGVAGADAAVDRDELPNTGASEAAVLTAAGLALLLGGRTLFDVRGWLRRPTRRLAPHAYRTQYSRIIK